MEYELSKRLIEIAETDKKVNRRTNLSAFLSLRPQINKAIKDGWSIKFIWETLHQDKKIHIGYRMFLRMVKQHINHLPESDKDSMNSKKEDSGEKSPGNDHQAGQTQDRNKGTTESAKYPDSGNPKGFEWDTDYNVDDFV